MESFGDFLDGIVPVDPQGLADVDGEIPPPIIAAAEAEGDRYSRHPRLLDQHGRAVLELADAAGSVDLAFRIDDNITLGFDDLAGLFQIPVNAQTGHDRKDAEERVDEIDDADRCQEIERSPFELGHGHEAQRQMRRDRPQNQAEDEAVVKIDVIGDDHERAGKLAEIFPAADLQAVEEIVDKMDDRPGGVLGQPGEFIDDPLLADLPALDRQVERIGDVIYDCRHLK